MFTALQSAVEVFFSTTESLFNEDGQERLHAVIPNPEQLVIKKDIIEHASQEVQLFFAMFDQIPSEIAEILTSAPKNATMGTAFRKLLKKQGYSDRKIRRILDECKGVLHEICNTNN